MFSRRLTDWLISAAVLAAGPGVACAQGGAGVAAVERSGEAWTAELLGGLRAHVLSIGDPADPDAPVVVTAAIDAGEQDESGDERGLARYVAHAMGRPQATGAGLPFEVVEQAGVRLEVEISPSGIVATAWCKPDAVGVALDAVAGALTSPGFDDRSLAGWRIEEAEHIARFGESAAGLLNGALAWSMPGPQRELIRPMTQDDLDAVSVEQGRRFFEDQVLSAATRVAVAGAVEPLATLELVGEHFGAIGGRAADGRRDGLFGLDADRDGMIEARSRVEPNRTLASGRSLVAVGLSGVDIAQLRSVRTLVLARAILAERLEERLREQRAAGAPATNGWTWLTPGYAFRDFGMLLVVAITPSENAEAAERMLWALIGELAADGPGEQEMAAVRAAVAEAVERQLTDPGWASRTMAEAELVGFEIDELLAIGEGYASITGQDIRRELSEMLAGEGQAARIGVRVDAHALKTEKDSGPGQAQGR